MKDKQKRRPIVDNILELTQSIELSDLDELITDRLKRSNDKRAAVEELDRNIAMLLNWALTASMFLKQKYLLSETTKPQTNFDELKYTKQEVAIKYRVSIRTVGNWIISGLETVRVGGVIRISHSALESFAKSGKTKKFNWKSPGLKAY